MHAPQPHAPSGHLPHPRRAVQLLKKLLPYPQARHVNVVSDACMVNSVLGAYGLVGPQWQTGSTITHADWSRPMNGHPGAYTREALQLHPRGVMRVRTPSCCCRSYFAMIPWAQHDMHVWGWVAPIVRHAIRCARCTHQVVAFA